MGSYFIEGCSKGFHQLYDFKINLDLKAERYDVVLQAGLMQVIHKGMCYCTFSRVFWIQYVVGGLCSGTVCVFLFISLCA